MPLAPHTRARLHASLAALVTTLIWWLRPGPWTAAFALLALGFAALAWLFPTRYVPVQRALDWLSRAFLIAFTWLALGLVYFGVLTPLRLWGILTRRDPLRPRSAYSTETYLEATPPAAPNRFDRQF